MTPRHVGRQLSLAEFAARADIARVTLQVYITRHRQDPEFMAANPVPAPCGQIGGKGRWWCERHADRWINNRPRKTKETE